MLRSYRLCEIEEILADTDTTEIADDIVETDEDMQLIVRGYYVHIPELNLYLREGVVCIWEEEEKLFMPDFAVTVIYENELETGTWINYEQDGFVVTLANWLNGRCSIEQIVQLKCNLVMPDEAIYKKERN